MIAATTDPALKRPERRKPAASLPNIVWALVALATGGLLLYVWRAVINGNGDSLAVISGTHFAAGCIGAGKLSSCGGEVAPYPLLQYLPTALLMRLGLADESILRALGILSSLAFAGIIGVAAFTLRRGTSTALLAVGLLFLFASPLPWYAWSTFGESLGAFACVSFVAAAALRSRPAVLGVTLMAAGQTKETALPFLLVLGIALLLWSTLSEPTPRRAHWAALAAGSFGSLALTGGFNWFRFGQLTNLVYADPIAHVPGIELKAKFAGSIWLAPNAGVLPFWPGIGVLLISIAIIAVRALRAPGPAPRRIIGGTLAIGLVLAGLTVGYASWYAPFGWIAWGPRLMLLMLPAIVLSALALFAPELDHLLVARGRIAAWLLTGALAVTIAGALPQLGVLHNSGVIAALFAPDATCPIQQPIGDNPGYYYTCIFHWAWWKHWMLPGAVKGLWWSPWAVALTLVWLSLFGALAATAASCRARTPAP